MICSPFAGSRPSGSHGRGAIPFRRIGSAVNHGNGRLAIHPANRKHPATMDRDTCLGRDVSKTPAGSSAEHGGGRGPPVARVQVQIWCTYGRHLSGHRCRRRVCWHVRGPGAGPEGGFGAPCGREQLPPVPTPALPGGSIVDRGFDSGQAVAFGVPPHQKCARAYLRSHCHRSGNTLRHRS